MQATTKAFILGMGASVGLGIAFAIYRDNTKRERMALLSSEIYQLVEQQSSGVLTPEEMKEFSDYVAQELVLHGYENLNEYTDIEADIAARVALVPPVDYAPEAENMKNARDAEYEVIP